MAKESKKDEDTRTSLDTSTEEKNSGTTAKKKQRGLFSRIWNGLFRRHGDDFEKRLQNISKEETIVLARMKKRSQTWRRMTRHLIVFSVIFEVIAVGYAIMTTRSLDLSWKMRASRVLPMFLLPASSFLAYSGLVSFSRMCDRKDQKTLERLRAERQEKIDELKERTNYYITQQLIQRYDPDPAAKAAAATVLASKLGADSGLRVYVGDESNLNVPTRKSNDVDLVQSDGLRNRKQSHTKSGTAGSTVVQQTENEMLEKSEVVDPDTFNNNSQLVVRHHQAGLNTNAGGWIAKVAALLVGEDPTQSYALICGNCHVHNGLARKEDYPYITYYCPHCHALNKSQLLDSSSNTKPGNVSFSTTPSNNNPIQSESGITSERPSLSSSPTAAVAESKERSETIVSGDSNMVS